MSPTSNDSNKRSTYNTSALRDGAVDGEVSVDGPHLVLVTVGHTLDQVLDVRADGAHGCQLLLAAEPFLNLGRMELCVHSEPFLIIT